MECPNCKTDNPEGARFCMNCGEKLVAICPSCGAETPPQAIYCPSCGTAMQAGSTEAVRQQSAAAFAQAAQRLIPREFAQRLYAARGQVSTERRLVTILFCDVKGSTAMGENLDPEEWMEIMNGAFEFLIPPVYRHEGTLARLMGDAILAFFGAPIAHEDDPERAIRAGLEITAEAQRYAETLRAERGIEGFDVRVGINTGLVVVGEVGSDLRVEYTAMGDAVNLAARLEQAAPPGGVLITHDAYRHVRGVFDVLPQEPLTVRGKSEPVQTYIVLQAKPRAFRLETRGVEGIETRTIGREAELQVLQNAYFDAVEGSETRVAMVSGDAGVGKSRLLYEFLNWAELRPEHFWLFKGRASAETQVLSYGVLRDLFSNRFEILESDSPATALAKFRAGMKDFLKPDRADLVGHLAGFDFSASEAVSNLLGSDAFAQLANAYLLQYVRGLVAQQPVMVLLEDMHWADDSSLDWIDQVVAQLSEEKLLVVCLARPALFERRPNWGEGRQAYVHLTLRPLSRRQSRALVAEILKRAEAIPDDLCDLIVDSAEGNPFYVEELIKMLLEEGVIVREPGPPELASGEQPWRVELLRLQELHVPPTLTGVLQARLDSLPREAKEVLQRASVVGRVFWDGAVAALAADEAMAPEAAAVAPLLDSVRERELVFRRERSSFAGSEEYIFKHLILHDVTYQTVLLKLRRVYHKRVALWLETNAGERVGEYAGLIAEHYERAGEARLAAQWLGRVVEAADFGGAWRQVLTAGEKALTLLPEGEKAARAALLVHMGEAENRLGSFPAARERLTAGLELARETGYHRMAARALSLLAYLCYMEGKFAHISSFGSEALALARAAGDLGEEARALSMLGIGADSHERDFNLARSYYEQALAISRKAGDRRRESASLNNLGELARAQGDWSSAARYYEESLAGWAEMGNRHLMPITLFNLGEVAAAQNDLKKATRYFQESLDISQEFGIRVSVALAIGGLGHAAAAAGDVSSARSLLRQALSEGRAIGGPNAVLYALVGLARLKAQDGEHVQAAEWLGLVLGHPAGEADALMRAERLLSELRAALSADQLEATLARGAKLDLDEAVAGILPET
jgi:class 3 adenylate cyclase/tetratricopeptide (TPR) repeat protein